jgi:hypothetical protein
MGRAQPVPDIGMVTQADLGVVATVRNVEAKEA